MARAAESDRDRIGSAVRNLAKAMDGRIFARIHEANRLFCAREKNPGNLTNCAQDVGSPVRHQAHKRRVTREFFAISGL
jgi:hypothetical protein